MTTRTFLERVKYFGIRKIYHTGRSALREMLQSATDLGFVNKNFQQSLIKRKTSRILINYYRGDQGHNINQTQFFLGFGLIHYAIIRNLRPQNILCIGSLQGYIPAVCALACKDNNLGHVDFVDAGLDDSQLHKKRFGGIGFWRKNNPKKHFERLNLSPWITSHIMTTKNFASLNRTKRYEYIYIDGDHSYEGAKLDYALFWPKLKKGGFMALHDISKKGDHNNIAFEVGKLWQELEKRHKYTFVFPNDSGLGFIQK